MEIWFDPQTAGKFGGIIGGCLGAVGAIIGCTCGFCIRKGYKILVYTTFIFVIAISLVLLMTGSIALFCKQPYHVWYSFMLPGFLGTVIFSSLFPVMRKRFIDSEMRQMQAKDL